MTKPVGVVVYRVGKEPGTLDADWAQSDTHTGAVCAGQAVGGPSSGFAGDYVITYKDEQGLAADPLDFSIREQGSLFHLTWKRDGMLMNTGIGVLCGDTLVAGWH